MEQRVSVWARLWRSAWSRAAYQDAAAARPKAMVGYLAVLIVLATIVMTTQAHLAVVQGLGLAEAWMGEYLPEIRIHDGIVSSPVAQPWVFEEEGAGFVLDTTGATTDLDPKYPRGMLLTRSELVYRKSPVATRRYDLSRIKDFVLNKDTVKRFAATLRSWLWVAIAVGLILWLWVAKLVQVLIWSLLGLIVSAVSGRSLAYRSLFNLGIYALTAPLVYDLVRGSVVGLPGWGSLALYAGYLMWGILAQPRATST